ncbi:MAG: SAM-dependent methyltransferase, partial [Deltaproteobacteria bacterium]|nr:SAM-dependent methyltransferase [Deltaproteobacteria bacterium]
MQCRHCRAPLRLTLVDLGAAPPSNSYITLERLNSPERWYPLRVLVCERCWLAQTEDFTEAQELFDEEYAYFSSYSSGWLNHAARYVESISERLELSGESLVMEVASNDGYLLKNFVARDVPCFGVEPTR